MNVFEKALNRCRREPVETVQQTIKLSPERERRDRRRAAEVARFDAQRRKLSRAARRFIRRCRDAGIDPWSIGTKQQGRNDHGRDSSRTA